MTESNTIKFTVPSDDKENMRTVLRSVFDALNEKGYNPINQIVGYIISYVAGILFVGYKYGDKIYADPADAKTAKRGPRSLNARKKSR